MGDSPLSLRNGKCEGKVWPPLKGEKGVMEGRACKSIGKTFAYLGSFTEPWWTKKDHQRDREGKKQSFYAPHIGELRDFVNNRGQSTGEDQLGPLNSIRTTNNLVSSPQRRKGGAVGGGGAAGSIKWKYAAQSERCPKGEGDLFGGRPGNFFRAYLEFRRRARTSTFSYWREGHGEKKSVELSQVGERV